MLWLLFFFNFLNWHQIFTFLSEATYVPMKRTDLVKAQGEHFNIQAEKSTILIALQPLIWMANLQIMRIMWHRKEIIMRIMWHRKGIIMKVMRHRKAVKC
jgi:hypothetical protein